MKSFECLIMQGRQRNYLALFLSYFKTLGIGPDPGIELLIYSIIIIIIIIINLYLYTKSYHFTWSS